MFHNIIAQNYFGVKKILIPYLLLIMPIYALSQNTTNAVKKSRSYYFYWGYHRNFYAPSNIHYKSEHYDFTLYDAKANDMPASLKQYFDVKNISVPQYNVRFGAEWKNNWFISIGVDHHKYRLTPTQNIQIGGYIDPSSLTYYNADSSVTSEEQYTGAFSDQDSLLYRREFMDFHHSNGMNQFRISIEKRIPLFDIPKIKTAIELYAGAGLGAIVCWTDFTFFRTRFLNNLHLSGWGMSGLYGVRFVHKNRFFVQYGFQNGFNFLTDIQLENKGSSARAQQNIHYFERGVQVGWIFGNVGSKLPITTSTN
jgi:hypothetical protein